MKYENDTTLITLEELEKLLCKMTGDEELSDSGCRCWNGFWFSPEHIMEYIKKHI